MTTENIMKGNFQHETIAIQGRRAVARKKQMQKEHNKMYFPNTATNEKHSNNTVKYTS